MNKDAAGWYQRANIEYFIILIAVLAKVPDFWRRLKAVRRGAGQYWEPDGVVKHEDFSSLL